VAETDAEQQHVTRGHRRAIIRPVAAGRQTSSNVECEALRDRFQQFALEFHPDKTRLIRFDRFAHRDCRRFDGRKKPETFNFLGFTHTCGVNRAGKFLIRR
jgi:hypothetical protein